LFFLLLAQYIHREKSFFKFISKNLSFLIVVLEQTATVWTSALFFLLITHKEKGKQRLVITITHEKKTHVHKHFIQKDRELEETKKKRKI